jgi:hypothetical protein
MPSNLAETVEYGNFEISAILTATKETRMVYLNIEAVLKSILLFLTSVITLAAQPNSFGTAVGAKIPDFSAPDQNGVSQRFDAIKGAKGAMLVFFRSADW